MEILVERKWPRKDYTVGICYVNGERFSETLEDADRGLRQDMTLSQLKKLKKYGSTAIPTGTYEVKSYFWPKYRKYYPWIQNVPAYEGILIHGGATHAQTLGCVLVGENKQVGKLTNCEKYVRKLTSMVQECEKRGEKVTITII